jgi:hypothetical protein
VPAKVAPGAADTICDFADGFIVHITGASDVDAAVRALAAARDDIAVLAPAHGRDDGPVISNPVLAPGGPLLRVARLGVGDDVLRTVPDLVVRQLDAHGAGDATVTSPAPGGSLDRLDSCPNAVVLRLFPAPAGEEGILPPAWIDIACEWVLGDSAPSDTVPARLLGIGFDLPAADAPSIVHQASRARAWCDLVNGDLDDRVRTASITFGRAPHVALAAGGPACDSSALLARFDLLCEVARELAPDVTYACVDVEETFESVGLGLTDPTWRDRGGASPNLVAGELVDVLVPDAFPYQILGKGHLARFDPDTTEADEPAIGEVVADGKVEVLIGDPADWLPIFDVRADAQAEGWEILEPLLADGPEVDELLAERPGRQVEDEVPEPTPAPAPVDRSAMPDLEDITLETLPHSRRGLRLTFLELVSWLAHEHHSDAPTRVSPVLATYGRWFASALDDRRRQELKIRARRMIGTGTSPASPGRGPVVLSPADVRRAWLATDWLIRVQAGCWLKLAGLTEAASRLESIGPTSDRHELVRAVDVLGSAIGIAARRLDLTASIAGTDRADDVELVDHAAWDAWDQASEASGWVAASEASGVGVPADLAYATDLRVIECARDQRARDELEAGKGTIGDAAWATALHAMADEAWNAGWDAAGPAVDGLAVLPLRTALDRATRAAFASQPDVDDDEREQSLEHAEAAAKELLTSAALGMPSWTADKHPWDAALEAASSAPGGELWSRVQHLARAAVDEGPWEAGMAAARAAVDDVLREAPDLVARAVGAAVAREAAGAAARGVALRAAAVARAQGVDEAAAYEAARAALASTVAELQDAAFALLDELIAVPTPQSEPAG